MASTRSSASRDWDRHGRAAPFRRNEELLNLLPKGRPSPSPAAASPRTSSTKAPATRHSGAPGRGIVRSASRAASSSRRRGPFRFPSTVSRRHRHPRARFVPRSPPRFARRPRQRAAHDCRRHRRRSRSPTRSHAGALPRALVHLCIGHCADFRALPVAMLPALVRALLRSPPALCASLPRAVRSAPPATQIAVAASIRRLHRRRSSDLSYSANRLSDRPGRPWVPHPTHR